MSNLQADHPLFERALAELDRGDVAALSATLAEAPDLVRARTATVESPYEGYFHGATLLHHVAGNPTRGELPEAIEELARALLLAGADPDATCGGGPAQPESAGGTVLGLVASSARAHLQGHSEGLIDVLLEHGATLDPDGGMWIALYHTVEHRGQREVARMLHERGVRADLPSAAGLGRLDLVRSFFRSDGSLAPDADDVWRRTVRRGERATRDEVLADSLLCAAVNGRPRVVAFLLDQGAPIDRLRSWGPYSVTALHGAAWAGWPDVVSLLVERGADPTIVDPAYRTTPRGWAEHCSRSETVDAFARAGVER
jgi:hypothetical protein